MKINVYRCDHTDKIFFGTPEYRTHLRTLAHKRICQHKQQKALRELLLLRPVLHKSSTFDEIGSWVTTHCAMLHRANNDRWDEREAQYRLDLLRFEIEHRDIVKAGYGGSGILREEPGWFGKVHYQFQKCLPSEPRDILDRGTAGLDLFKNIGMYLGSGSGDSYLRTYRQTIVLFDNDWPSLVVRARLNGEL